MNKLLNNLGNLCVCIVFIFPLVTNASERSFDAYIDAHAEYNDNIFLTELPHGSVTGIIITPSLSGLIEEQNWEVKLQAKIKSNHYSDQDLNSNDQYFDVTGRYIAERNIFSLNANYDLASNLNSTSSDFGVVGRRVNTENQSITPQYTRLLTERLVFISSYTYTDVDFLEAENTGFTPYISENISTSLIYDLTEKDKLTISLFAVDYASRNDLVTYQLLMSRFGIDHKFSETLSADFLLGVSRRNSTNLSTRTFDFFGNIITQTQEIDNRSRGLVLNAGVKQQYESGQLEGRVSRDNTTNSFGGLDQVDSFKLNYNKKLSSLWGYGISMRYDDITSISSVSRTTDRNTIFLETKAYYSINLNWRAVASYRYIQRRFKNDTSDSRAPHSSRIYIGLTYNFPSLSTF